MEVMPFWSKTAVHPARWEQVSMHGVSWFTDADGLLELSSSRGSLSCKGPTIQKIALVFLGGSPSS